MWFLRANFFLLTWVSEGIWTVSNILRGNYKEALCNVGAALLGSLVFHYALKLRASICRLPDKDLSEFLVETLFKGGIETAASMVFVIFRSTKCVMENSFRQCQKNSYCAIFISVYLSIRWGLKIVHGSIEKGKDGMSRSVLFF